MSQPEKFPFLPAPATARFREKVAEILRARSEPRKIIEYFHEDSVFHVIGTSHDYSFSGDYLGRETIRPLPPHRHRYRNGRAQDPERRRRRR